ncbi:DUF262 domain-containing protein [Spirosoma sp. RP8]|uniref:DUF262 domain-containing protein n=1 Tax=Spirosoma liriopis TaxID=2937440 RepID=A0ABT0HV50_9BACT|nr:DUF262 domain-containing protein [Spirosoma liriopis]MCK8496071.1 DUF262 domain-containing protein [Spirosoma liriopis]
MEADPKDAISDIIDKKIGEVRTDNFDITFGEIVSLHKNKELVIQPEYQRLFRWSYEQRSRLIESVLLELPIPQIFLMETGNGVLELIDGLQRVSTVIQFIEPQELGEGALTLEGCDLVKELNNLKYENLPLVMQLKIKRSKVRAVIIKRQSKSFLKYEMFKRLNTGGAKLQPQEIRNCSARMLGNEGTEFYSFLKRMSENHDFMTCIETLSTSDKEQKGDEELVLRFFALKNAGAAFKQNVTDWLDSYMEGILVDPAESKMEKYTFNMEEEEEAFNRTFGYIASVMGSGAFVKYRDGKPVGGLAPAYYESVTMGVYHSFEHIVNKPSEQIRETIISVLQTQEFKANTGPSSNTRAKFNQRIELVKTALLAI